MELNHSGICKECGCKTFTITQILKSACAFEHLIDDSIVCLNCIKETHRNFVLWAGSFLIKPAKHGENCPQKSDECFLGRLNSPACYDDDDGYSSRGPTDLRDDWPHA